MLDSLRGITDPRQRVTRRVVATGVLLAAVALVGIALADRYVQQERQRELGVWQARLGVIADSRAAAVSDWLQRQMATIQGLARNQTIELYLTELSAGGGDPATVTDEPAQAAYIRNLLVATADRTGFLAPPPSASVPANVERPRIAGLALIDAQGRVVVATPELPSLSGRLADFLRDLARPEGAIEDIYAGAGGRPTVAFAAPVFPVQGDASSAKVGAVIGIKDVGSELFPLLARPQTVEKSDETILVRRAGATVEYLSPLQDGTPALRKRVPISTPGLGEAWAISAPGDYGVGRDYRDIEVLLTSRPLELAPWTLIHKIDREEALGPAEARLNRLLALMVLGVLLVVIALVAVWRHGASRRASEAAQRFETLARRYESQGQLLRLVTDSQPATIFIADLDSKVHFANKVLAQRFGVQPGDLVGKTLSSILGPADARRYEIHIREAINRQAIQPAIHRTEIEGKPLVLHTEHVPLPATNGGPQGVLVVEEDITAPVVERERRERTLRQLVRTLVQLVDRRDPFAAHHSQRVATVARRIAEEMGLDPVMVETAEIAGSLMNLGKILVPAQILTRSGALTDEERRQVRESLKATADLIARVEFDGPVVETLRQAQETWDGSGPQKLKGVEILVTARVVAVANAFVALASARAHRPGLDLDKAAETILAQAGTSYDRRVVAALLNDLENRGGRARWADFSAPPAAAAQPSVS